MKRLEARTYIFLYGFLQWNSLAWNWRFDLMARIKPQTLLQQSKKKKGPSRISLTTIVTCSLIVALFVFFLHTTYRHWSNRSVTVLLCSRVHIPMKFYVKFNTCTVVPCWLKCSMLVESCYNSTFFVIKFLVCLYGTEAALYHLTA